MRPSVRTLVVLPVLVLAACNGGSTSPLTDGTPAGETTTEAPAGPDATGEAGDAGELGETGSAAVEIVELSFRPDTVAVPAGTEVTWTNQDGTAHTVTAGTPDAPEPDRFDLGLDGEGETASTTFDDPGAFAYHCRFHPAMTGTVEVTDA